jgi:fibronectin-binding autotransporter adhesin
MALTAASTYAGGTTISGGVLQITANSNLGSVNGVLILDGGTLQVAGTAEVDTNRPTTLGPAGATLDIPDSNPGGLVLGANITGPGALTKTGDGLLKLNGANSYQGGTFLNAGTLQITSSGNLGTGGLTFGGSGAAILDIEGANAYNDARPIMLAANATIQQDDSAGATLTDNITGGNVLTKTGAGTLILSGTGDAFSAAVVSSGTLTVIAADVLPDGTNLTVGAGGTFIFDPSMAGSPAAASSISPVPEPGTLMLLSVGAIGLLGYAWRRRRSVGIASNESHREGQNRRHN